MSGPKAADDSRSRSLPMVNTLILRGWDHAPIRQGSSAASRTAWPLAAEVAHTSLARCRSTPPPTA
jgi:hypothetical protein